MAMVILDTCINCGSCEPDCPNTAISQGESYYVIEAAKCTECVGAFDEPKCVEICPVEGCIIHDPEHQETREELQARYESMHAN